MEENLTTVFGDIFRVSILVTQKSKLQKKKNSMIMFLCTEEKLEQTDAETWQIVLGIVLPKKQ